MYDPDIGKNKEDTFYEILGNKLINITVNKNLTIKCKLNSRWKQYITRNKKSL